VNNGFRLMCDMFEELESAGIHTPEDLKARLELIRKRQAPAPSPCVPSVDAPEAPRVWRRWIVEEVKTTHAPGRVGYLSLSGEDTHEVKVVRELPPPHRRRAGTGGAGARGVYLRRRYRALITG